MTWKFLLLILLVCQLFGCESKHFKDEDLGFYDNNREHRVIPFFLNKEINENRWGRNQFKTNTRPAATDKNKKNSRKLILVLRQRKSQSTPSDIFENEVLEAHNVYRRKHGVPPLIISRQLCKYAKEWAATLTKLGNMEHRDQKKYGENLFYAWSSNPNFTLSGRVPVDKWYSESKDYKFGSEPVSLNSGHFTQIVWKNTRKVGVAMTKSENGEVYVVANYYPLGNIVGTFKENVPPPIN